MTLRYHKVFESKLEGKYAKAAERLQPSGRVLEIGCHSGYFSRFLMDQNYQVLGIELDETAAQAARRLGVEVLVRDIENPDTIHSLSERFDVVFMMDVLEHLKDPVAVLRRLKSVLTPTGRLILTIPNIAYWAMRKNLLLGRWDYTEGGIMDNTHLRFFTASTCKTMLTESGYQITHFAPADGMLPAEQYFAKLPLLQSLVSPLRNLSLKAFPTLFTVDFLIEALPCETTR